MKHFQNEKELKQVVTHLVENLDTYFVEISMGGTIFFYSDDEAT